MTGIILLRCDSANLRSFAIGRNLVAKKPKISVLKHHYKYACARHSTKEMVRTEPRLDGLQEIYK